jgi:multiple sugar transport system substrate-binding protein
MKLKMVSAAAVAALALPLLVGCSSSPNGTSSSGETHLTMAVWAGSEAESAAWKHLADLVHEEDPSISVKLQTAAWNDYWTKVPTLLAGSDAPCIAGMQMARLQQFKQFLVPLDDKLKAAGIDAKDFDPGIMKALSVDGKQMAIPYDLGPYIVYYNKDALAAAGLSDPALDWTTSDFETYAQKLTGAGKYGFGVDNTIDVANIFGPTIGGAQAATKSGKLAVDSAGIRKTMEWYAGLVNKDGVAAPLSASSSVTASSQFLGGNAAMYVSGPWDMINIKAQAKFKVGIATVPQGSVGPVTSVGGSGFGVTQKCQNQAAAAKAISIITGPKALSYLGSNGRAFPARTAEQGTWYKEAVPGSKLVLETALKTGVPYLSTPTWTQDGLNWTQGIISVVNDGSSVDKFLAGVQSESGSN